MPPKGYLSARRKPKKQKTFLGFKVGKPPKSDQQKRVDAGATVIATRKLDSGKSLISTEKATGRVVSRAEEQQKVKAGSSKTMQGGPRTVAYVSKPKPKPATGKGPPKFYLETQAPKAPSKPKLDVAGAYTGPRNIGGKGAYKGYITSTKQPPPSKPKIVTSVKPPSESGSSSSGSQTIPKLPVSKPTLLRGNRSGPPFNKVVKSGFQGGNQTAIQFLKNQTISPTASAKSIDKALGNVNLGLGQSLSPSKSFKSLMSLIGVNSGTSGNTRGSFSGGGVMRNNQTSSASSVQHKQMNPKNYLASSDKTLVSGQTRLRSPYTLNQIKTKDGTIKMKELTGTNTGVKRNQQSSGKALNLGGSLWSWWKQKGIEQKKKTNQQFYGIQRNLPRNIGNAP